jgi:hypothetical protein
MADKELRLRVDFAAFSSGESNADTIPPSVAPQTPQPGNAGSRSDPPQSISALSAADPVASSTAPATTALTWKRPAAEKARERNAAVEAKKNWKRY